MPRQPSNAEIYSARFNPDTSNEDRDVLGIVHSLESDGFNFKQIASDAILRVSGRTPEMYATPIINQMLTSYLDGVLAQFAQEIILEIRRGGVSPAVSADDEQTSGDKPSRFAQSFARSFVERQRRAMGENEE